MGNFSRNTYKINESKGYNSVRLQQGVPLVDADWNEMDDIRRYQLKDFINTYIGNGVPDDDGFRINCTGSKIIIQSGSCLVNGWFVHNPYSVEYREQKLYSRALADQWKVEPLMPLSELLDNTDYYVVLDVWEREVNAEEDSELIDSRIGIETCVRIKLEWVVRILKSPPPDELPLDPPQGHAYCLLAEIVVEKTATNISFSLVSDLRLTNVFLGKIVASTGVVRFGTDTKNNDAASAPIDPSLGEGPFILQLALVDRNSYVIGNPEVFATARVPIIGARVNLENGTFVIGIKVTIGGIPETRVRWWAIKPKMLPLADQVVSPGISVTIAPDSKTLDQGASQVFKATVSQSSKGVNWEVLPGGAGGTITPQQGLSTVYTSPSKLLDKKTDTIKATSLEAPTRSDTASVTVNAVSVVVSPPSFQAPAGSGRTPTFNAEVKGSTNKAVTWNMHPVESEAGATMTYSGNSAVIYIGPKATGPYTLDAISVADNTQKGTATVNVTIYEPPSNTSVTIKPESPSVPKRGSITFHATVVGISDKTVKWSVEPVPSNPAGGGIEKSGKYTAPNRNGKDYVVATAADGTTAKKTVTVESIPPCTSGSAGGTCSGNAVEGRCTGTNPAR